MHVALCHCDRCDSLKSLNTLNSSIWSLTSWIMYIIIIYSSHTGYTMKVALLSCCTTIPCCTMQGGFHLAGCRVHSGSLHRKVQFVAAWKLVCGSIQINPKIVQSKSWLQYSHTSCPSMVFHDSLWNLTGFKLVCPWQKFSRRPCLKSCISSCNLGAQRATLIDSWSSTNTAHFSSIKAHEKTFTDISGAGIPPDDVGDGPTKSRSAWTKKKWISKKWWVIHGMMIMQCDQKTPQGMGRQFSRNWGYGWSNDANRRSSGVNRRSGCRVTHYSGSWNLAYIDIPIPRDLITQYS